MAFLVQSELGLESARHTLDEIPKAILACKGHQIVVMGDATNRIYGTGMRCKKRRIFLSNIFLENGDVECSLYHTHEPKDDGSTMTLSSTATLKFKNSTLLF